MVFFFTFFLKIFPFQKKSEKNTIFGKKICEIFEKKNEKKSYKKIKSLIYLEKTKFFSWNLSVREVSVNCPFPKNEQFFLPYILHRSTDFFPPHGKL